MITHPTLRLVVRCALGLAFGYTLSRLGFSDFDQVHAMFSFADLRLLFTFMGAVVISAIGAAALGDSVPPVRRAIHRGTVAGAVLFGVGWALIGACPGAILVQLGELQPLAFVSALGVFVGTFASDPLHRRFFRWEKDSC